MNNKRIIVIGASAAGLRCACRLARLRPDWEITVIEKQDAFSYAACGMPYVLSGDIEDPSALRKTGDGMLRDNDYFKNIKGIEILSGTQALEINAEEKKLKTRGKDGEKELQWDELVLATGAKPRKLPGQPGHPRVFSFHDMNDLMPLKQGLERGEIGRVIIVGAGFIGCEISEAFAALWGAEVVLLEAAQSPLPGILDNEVSAIITHSLKNNSIEVHTSSKVEKIEPGDDGVTVTACGKTHSGDIAVVALGVSPETELAGKAGIETGATGAIKVDEKFATSVPGIWAIGDCIEVKHAVTGKPVHFPLGSLANRQGRTLANIIDGRSETFPQATGTISIKVFDINTAAVGLTMQKALDAGIKARSSWICAHDTADYWPESKEIVLQLVYDADTKKVLGVQAAGEGEVAKRIDVASMLIARGATLHDFCNIEHAYSPPYSPAIDPLAFAAFAALNQEDGVFSFSPLTDLKGKKVLDVRHNDEREERPAPADDLLAIPLENLRERISEVGDEEWHIVCERGARSSEALRILKAKGIKAQYMGGGLRWLGLAGLL